MADMRIIDLADDILLMITPLVAERLRELRRIYIIEESYRYARIFGRLYTNYMAARYIGNEWDLCFPHPKITEQIDCMKERRDLLRAVRVIETDCDIRYDI